MTFELLASAAADAAGHTSTPEAVLFWVLGTVAVAGAIGVVAAPKAVYSAMFLATTMIVLAVFYIAQDALFLGVVQVVVYTGAVMMLFLFVVMLIGVDSSESLVETIRGQRVAAIVVGVGFGILVIAGIGNVSAGGFTGLAQANAGGNVQGLAVLIFTRVPVGVRADRCAADHRRSRRDGAGPPRTFRTPQDPTRTGPRSFPAGWASDDVAQSRCVRPQQRRRHGGPPSRRIGIRAVRQRTPAEANRESDQRRRCRRMNPDNYLYLSALLFTIGASGVLLRRNAIVMFMCVELMLNACNLAFVAFSRMHGHLDGQVVAFFTMVVAACEVVVGLAIIMTIFRARRSASVDDASLLKH